MNSPEQTTNEKLYSPKQIALLANLPLKTIHRWLEKDTPENPVFIGKGSIRKHRVYRLADVEKWLSKQRKRGIQANPYYLLGKEIAELEQSHPQHYKAIMDILDNAIMDTLKENSNA